MRKLRDSKRHFEGIFIPQELWEDKELSVTEKIFLVEVKTQEKNGKCYERNSHFADFFDISKGRASQIVSKLGKKGYVRSNIIRDSRGEVLARELMVTDKAKGL